MKQSQFNVVKSQGEDTWIFNTLTLAFIKISTQIWQSLSSCDDKDLIDALFQQDILFYSQTISCRNAPLSI